MTLVSIMIIVAALFFVIGLIKKVRNYAFGGGCLLVGAMRAGWIIIADTSMVFVDLIAAALSIIGVLVLTLTVSERMEITRG